MKHTKKALALLMVLVMSLSLLTVTAFAAGTGKITIENATAGMEYKLYKVFDASYIDGTADGTKPAGATYTIKSTDPWYSLVSASGSPFTLKEDPTHPLHRFYRRRPAGNRCDLVSECRCFRSGGNTD